MPLWMLKDAGECQRAFQSRYGRPAPWYEIAALSELEDLSWKLGSHMRLEHPSAELPKTCRAAAGVMRKKFPGADGLFRGFTEELPQACKRFGIPTDGAVWLWRSWWEAEAVRMRMRDLLAFHEMLWNDDCWAIDESGDWILAGIHDWAACWLDFRRE